MRTPLVIMETSALGNQQKHSILANDLVRRPSNMGQSLPMADYVEVINNYTYKLKASGYSYAQAKEIIVLGIRGYKNKIKRRIQEGQVCKEDTGCQGQEKVDGKEQLVQEDGQKGR